MAEPADVDPFLSGERLWGDDFDAAERAAWFEDEREGFADLAVGSDDLIEGGYGFSGMNWFHGYRHLPDSWRGRVLGLGAATGEELVPVAGRASSISVVEPSQRLRSASVGGVPIEYVTPAASGRLHFDDGAFDLVTCFGVLHHIANVSDVLAELGRVAAPGGYLLLREPVVSMGDWRTARPGLTKRERGIPPKLLDRAISEAGFDVLRAEWCDFPTTRRLASIHGSLGYGSAAGAALDAILARSTAWNHRYHAAHWWQKIRPISRFYVAIKDSSPSRSTAS